MVTDRDGIFRRRDEIVAKTSLQTATAAYQNVVKFLLEQNDYPGTSSEELQRFKTQFRGAAFTCRFGTCPSATTGFDSAAERDEHELTHSKFFTCPIPDCKYPALVSKAAVQRHIKKLHPENIHRRPIRRKNISSIQASKNPNAPPPSGQPKPSQSHPAAPKAFLASLMEPPTDRQAIIPDPTESHAPTEHSITSHREPQKSMYSGPSPQEDETTVTEEDRVILELDASVFLRCIGLTPDEHRIISGRSIPLAQLFWAAQRYQAWLVPYNLGWHEVAIYFGFLDSSLDNALGEIQAILHSMISDFKKSRWARLPSVNGIYLEMNIDLPPFRFQSQSDTPWDTTISEMNHAPIWEAHDVTPADSQLLVPSVHSEKLPIRHDEHAQAVKPPIDKGPISVVESEVLGREAQFMNLASPDGLEHTNTPNPNLGYLRPTQLAQFAVKIIPTQEIRRLQELAIHIFNSISFQDRSSLREDAKTHLSRQELDVLQREGQDLALIQIQRSLFLEQLVKMNMPPEAGQLQSSDIDMDHCETKSLTDAKRFADETRGTPYFG